MAAMSDFAHSVPINANQHSSTFAGSKPRRKATVTPRTFRRFFAPRNALDKGEKYGLDKRPLGDITCGGINRLSDGQKRRSPTKNSVHFSYGQENQSCITSDLRYGGGRDAKSLDSMPESPSPSKRARLLVGKSDIDQEHDLSSDTSDEYEFVRRKVLKLPRPIVRSRMCGALGGTLQDELNVAIPMAPSPRLTYATERVLAAPDFVSGPQDIHLSRNIVAPRPHHALPFCTAACNTNSLVAVGDEEGGVRILETQRNGNPVFNRAYLTFRPHVNAILDLAFSSDDLRLATASGDQTAQVIDMPTQKATHLFSGHISSVKQVRFQPGSGNNVIATSSRDGSIQLWDLRCRGTYRPVSEVPISLDSIQSHCATTYSNISRVMSAPCVNIIPDAHLGSLTVKEPGSMNPKTSSTVHGPQNKGSIQHRSEVSVTTIAFLDASRPHLLLTGSEANATIKLWDLRMKYNQRSTQMPISTTRQPEAHGRHRQFGLTSMILSADAGRIYTLCKDNSIYAYSTRHLIMGSAPDLDSETTKSKRTLVNREGLGPLYGLRHPNLKASTFYVKIALRPAAADQCELLATGSSDSCVILFPTDERYLRHISASSHHTESTLPSTTRPWPSRLDSNSDHHSRNHDTIPIYQSGSALVRGHEKEVSAVTWSSEGNLVTIGDDMKCRVWREDPEKARELRVQGESGGNRWGYGWSRLGEKCLAWDDDD